MFAGLNMRAASRGYFRDDYLIAAATDGTIILPAPLMPKAFCGIPLTILKNGSLLFYGVDYTVSGRLVTLSVAPSTGDKYLVQIASPVRPNGASRFGGNAPVPFADVVSLLHFDGTNGGTTFTDVIGANTWTATGATTSTTAFKYGTASGKFVRASVQYIDMTSTTTGNVGANDFTAEAWINPTTVTTTSGQNNFIASKDDIGGGTRGWIINLSGTNSGAITSNVFVGATAYAINSAMVPTTGVWTHVALCRVGQICTLYVGGVNKGTVSLPSPSSVIGSSAYGVRIGNPSPSPALIYSFDGYIDDFRLTIGASQYTANFTPTGPFPNS